MKVYKLIKPTLTIKRVTIRTRFISNLRLDVTNHWTEVDWTGLDWIGLDSRKHQK